MDLLRILSNMVVENLLREVLSNPNISIIIICHNSATKFLSRVLKMLFCLFT